MIGWRTPAQMKRSPRRGFFLLMVLVVLTVSTYAVYSFSELMLVMDDAAHLQSDNEQALACVDSGTALIRVLLSQTPDDRDLGGGLYNNPTWFRAVPVAPDETGDGDFYFSALASGSNSEGQIAGIRFGIEDESGRLNVNALLALESNSEQLLPAVDLLLDEEESGLDSENLAVSLLMALPGMTEEIADAILDWLDEDDEARPYGAESETYSLMQTPYSAANGPITSVDELLLVRGVTPELLFGADANRNGVLDADEQQRYQVTVDSPGALGWSSLLTVYGSESNLRPDGTVRVNVNETDLELLFEDLLDAIGDDTYASYVIAYRMYGNPRVSLIDESLAQDSASGDPNPTDPGGVDGGTWTAGQVDDLDMTAGAQNTIAQIIDLIDSSVTISDGDETVTYQSPFFGDPVSMSAYLPLLMDNLSVSNELKLPGRLNINTCSVDLLRGIPMLDDETISAIVENRDPTSDDPNRRYATWLLAEGLVGLDQMQSLTPLVCGGGSVFRAQMIGYNAAGGAFSRAEIILDGQTVNPKVVSYRNLSHLGRGFDLSVLGRRDGQVQ